MTGRRTLIRLSTCAVALTLCTGSGFAADGDVVQIAGGLDNPRHLSIGLNGALYVAEAGKGGAGPCIPNPEGEGEVCYGATGAITRIQGGVQERVVTGLPSYAGADGGGATGPHDVAVTWYGAAYTTIGLGADPSVTAPGGAFAGLGFGTLQQFGLYGGPQGVVADLGAYEASANPDGAQPNSNPYGLLLTQSAAFVADAGGNSLVRVGLDGEDSDADAVRTVAVFGETMLPAPPFLGLPPGATISMQAVPTSVASGSDGLFVGQLTGFPFPVGGASVFEVTRDGDPAVFASGFTNIVDIEFGPFGSLYVVELASAGLLSGSLDGALTRVDPNGTRTSVPLFAPGGVAVDWTGQVYATVCSVCPGGGAVVKVAI